MKIKESNKIISEDLALILTKNIAWSEFNNLTILVTGANGFLASYLIKVLLAASAEFGLNIKIYAVVRSSVNAERLRDLKESDGLIFYDHDMSNPLPADFPKTDWVIHAASKASPKFYGTDPIGTLRPNAIGTLNLLEHAVKNNTHKFLFISSGEVYGMVSPDQIIDENAFGIIDTMNIRSSYAESKRMGELLTAIWSKQYDICGLVVRPFHTYGPSLYLDDGRVFSDFVSNVVNNEPIILKSDGKAERPFCYISDAVLGILTILISGSSSQAYNLGNPNGNTSIFNLAKMLSTLIPGRNVEIIKRANKNSDYLQSPVMHQNISIDKIQLLGWSPSTSLEVGFKRMILSYL